ncbi:hypothetical protein X777_03921 [Ooceraea biroi]|uniref:SWIM-type domain-containing protein n=1 Tax=Ooceraea biroi TaxID=2015173 RepID=A0A026WKA7_OOCBI|nr:hypothetical protein X777_03921 [Ooceraea biroi]
MAFRNLLRCYVYDKRFAPRLMTRIDGDENADKCEIAIRRRDGFHRPPLDVTHLTRICSNYNQSIRNEIAAIEQDPTCLQLNVLTQTRNSTCLICNATNDIHRISVECKANVFIVQNIYIPENVKSCRRHLDDRGFILQPFLDDDEFECFCPITKVQFRELFAYCDRIPCQGGYRYVSKKDLLTFLCKMRQGLSDDFLKVMFQYPSRQATSMAIATVRQSLMQLKPVLIVAPDGYILDIQGPYFSDSRNNNAAILRNEFVRDTERMTRWFQKNDIVIVDRGYRDATELLARLGIEPNVIQALVEIENLNTKNAQRWIRLDAEQLLDFPVLTLDFLKNLTVGVYQIKLAASYVQDKLQRDEEEEFQLEMLRDVNRLPQPGLMRVRIFSRFRNATKYQLWISYRPTGDNEVDDGMDNDEHTPIQCYYCTCKSGARTLSTCAHIASVIWFME